jgi:hypothetical protein
VREPRGRGPEHRVVGAAAVCGRDQRADSDPDRGAPQLEGKVPVQGAVDGRVRVRSQDVRAGGGVPADPGGGRIRWT